MADRWVQRWTAIGTSGKQYTVAMDRVGNFGCSCPAWTFSKVRPKPDCQHIMQKQRELAGTHPFPTIPTIPPIPRFAPRIELINNQTLSVTIQPVDANGDPVGPPLSATQQINIVPGGPQSFKASVNYEEVLQGRRLKPKKEKIAKKPIRAIELEK